MVSRGNIEWYLVIIGVKKLDNCIISCEKTTSIVIESAKHFAELFGISGRFFSPKNRWASPDFFKSERSAESYWWMGCFHLWLCFILEKKHIPGFLLQINVKVYGQELTFFLASWYIVCHPVFISVRALLESSVDGCVDTGQSRF